MKKSKIAYVSFDTVPSPKGAATHIAAFTQALAATFGQVQLVTVSPNTEIQARELHPGVQQIALPAIGDNLINRVLYFRTQLAHWWQDRQYDVVHFRSIYEGFPIALNKHKLCKYLIFEVNGLPSIELKYRYPAVADDRELLHKLEGQEQICLDAADLIITPSTVTGSYLQTRGVSPRKIRVIHNGVDLDIFTYACDRAQAGSFHMLYFGTLSAWQGVNLAIEAMALANRVPTKLTVIASGKTHQFARLEKLARKLNVREQLRLLQPLPQTQLVQQIQQADAVVAPLTPNDRNLVQGCCPLKVLEGMATGTPVIASDLSVVRELGDNERHFLLVKPGSAKAIKDAALRLAGDRELGMQLAIAARQRIETNYTWLQAGAALVEAYQNLIPTCSRTA